MTGRFYMMIEHPEAFQPEAVGGIKGCPSDYGVPLPAKCVGEFDRGLKDETCRACWEQPIPMKIKR